jgi:ligand-binding SRPBCC domain-containing protein
MVRIELQTGIHAPIERVFDLSRNVDLHMASTDFTGERAIAGVRSGCLELGQQVTWRGRHFGANIEHTSLITAYEFPHYFRDAMTRGMFRRFHHDHFFEKVADGTIMRDVMEFEAPCGVLGRIAERLALEKHLLQLIRRRNDCIKRVAESEEWSRYLPGSLP